jgi:hypothetical protein
LIRFVPNYSQLIFGDELHTTLVWDVLVPQTLKILVSAALQNLRRIGKVCLNFYFLIYYLVSGHSLPLCTVNVLTIDQNNLSFPELELHTKSSDLFITLVYTLNLRFRSTGVTMA